MSDPPQWTAERTTDQTRAAALVGRLAPQLGELPVTWLSQGWDNTVFRVGPEWAARFPRRAVALPGFRRELAVVPRIVGVLPLAVPVPRWAGEDDDPVEPWPVAIVRWIRGRELPESGLTDADRAPVARAVGEFLAELHGPGAQAAVADLDLPVDPMHRGWPEARLPATRDLLDRLAQTGTWQPDAAVHDLLDDAGALGAPAGQPLLVHGDLHVRHVLVGPDGTAGGVIDWGDVCRADPAVDLSVAWAAFSGPARTALLDAYGPVDGERELRARALAVRISAMLVDYAAEEDLPALLAESLAGLRRAVD